MNQSGAVSLVLRFPLIPESGFRRWFGVVMATALAGFVLVACAGDGGSDEERRFANQPVTEVAHATGELAATPPATVSPTTAATGSGRDPLDVRGAPSIVHAMVDGQVMVVDTGSGAILASIPATDGFTIADIASSASGERVAILEVPGEPGAANASVSVYTSSGEEWGGWDVPWPEVVVATPDAGLDLPGGSIAWSPGGDSLLVSLAGTSLHLVHLEGEVRPVEVPGNVGTIVDAALSPGGNDIAVLDVDPIGNGRVMVIDPVADTPAARQIAPPTADTAGQGSVNSFAWLPDGSGLVYILADERTAGALYRTTLAGGQRTLIASPGREGPAARITSFTLSPQGDSVAYTIGAPEGDAIAFSSLWVRSLKGSAVEQLPVAASSPVSQMWWIDRGLAWQDQPESLTIAEPDGESAVISLLPQATSEATPAASPVATPIVATPIASPQASPVASPVG